MRPIRDPHTLWQFGHVLSAGAGGPGLLIRATSRAFHLSRFSVSRSRRWVSKCTGSLQQTLPPSGTLLGNSLPRVDVDVTFPHARLEDVLEALFLPSPGKFTLTELGEEKLLRESVVRHLHKVTGPTKLLVDNHRLNAGGFCLREDADVGASVLPLDSEDLSQAALMVFLQRFKVSPAPCL